MCWKLLPFNYLPQNRSEKNMSAIYEMRSRDRLNRTRFAKQEKKKNPLYPSPPHLWKVRVPVLSARSLLTLTAPCTALQGKMFKNRVFVTSGEQGDGGWRLVRPDQVISRRVCQCEGACVTWGPRSANGSDWLRASKGRGRKQPGDLPLVSHKTIHAQIHNPYHPSSAMCLSLLFSNH